MIFVILVSCSKEKSKTDQSLSEGKSESVGDIEKIIDSNKKTFTTDVSIKDGKISCKLENRTVNFTFFGAKLSTELESVGPGHFELVVNFDDTIPADKIESFKGLAARKRLSKVNFYNAKKESIYKVDEPGKVVVLLEIKMSASGKAEYYINNTKKDLDSIISGIKSYKKKYPKKRLSLAMYEAKGIPNNIYKDFLKKTLGLGVGAIKVLRK